LLTHLRRFITISFLPNDSVNGLDRIIPLTVLRRAKGFAIFSIFRLGFLLTARAGSGVVIAKLPDGTWSAPSALGIGGIGGGFSAGAEVTDFIVVLNSRSAVRSFMATGSLQLGGNLSVAVGPVGRSAEASGALNSSGKVAAMFSYSKSQGLFGGESG
jgi:lipid-binding SYLF domain-containing protein